MLPCLLIKQSFLNLQPSLCKVLEDALGLPCSRDHTFVGLHSLPLECPYLPHLRVIPCSFSVPPCRVSRPSWLFSPHCIFAVQNIYVCIKRYMCVSHIAVFVCPSVLTFGDHQLAGR